MPILGVIASSAKGAPGIPTIGTATDVGTARAYNNGAATVTFSPGAGATATSYTVKAYTTGGVYTGYSGTGASSPVTVTGLQSSTQYKYTVYASNAAGNSDESGFSNTVTATTVPQAPTIGTATCATGQAYTGSANISVAFTAGATGGSAITSYTATSSSTATASGASSPIAVSQTVGSSYTYTVTATNANGTSAASGTSNSVLSASVPQAPTIGTASVLSSTSASVAFTGNATGGSAITSYSVTGSPAGSATGSSSPITVSGLTTGTAYTFTVRAVNAYGTSAASASSNSVTPNYTAISAWTSATAYPDISMYPQVGLQGGTTSFAWTGTGSDNSNTTSVSNGYYWGGSSWTNVNANYGTYQPGINRISSTESLMIGGYNFSGFYLANNQRWSGNAWSNGTAFPRTSLTPFVGKVSDGILAGMGTDGGNVNTVYKNTAWNGTWSASTAYPVTDANGYLAIDDGTMSFITVYNMSNTGVVYRTGAVSSTWTLQAVPPFVNTINSAKLNAAASAVTLILTRDSGAAYIYNNTTYTATTTGPQTYSGGYNTPVLSSTSSNTRVEWVDGQRQTTGSTRLHYYATLA